MYRSIKSKVQNYVCGLVALSFTSFLILFGYTSMWIGWTDGQIMTPSTIDGKLTLLSLITGLSDLNNINFCRFNV